MNAEGLLDPESFVQQEDQYKAKISSGRVLGMIDADVRLILNLRISSEQSSANEHQHQLSYKRKENTWITLKR